jgi:hypothetical protein
MDERTKWYKDEFNKISDEIKNRDNLDYFYFLRIRNYKLQNISVEEEEKIKKKTKMAFRLAKKRNKIKEAIETLTDLNGVRIPVASAILAMRYPDKFAIIDKRVIGALKEKSWLKGYLEDPEVYEKYLKRMKIEAKKQKKNLRDLELYLWEKGKKKSK